MRLKIKTKLSTHMCPGCTTEFKKSESVEHYRSAGIGRYGVASPECLATFFAVLARENELYGYPAAHRLIIDAYAAQHPRNADLQKKLGIEERLIAASIQSVPVHLIAIYCALEKQIPLEDIAPIMDRVLSAMNAHGIEFDNLSAPADLGDMNVAKVKQLFFSKEYTLEEYTELAFEWARVVWNAWQKEHAIIRDWSIITGA